MNTIPSKPDSRGSSIWKNRSPVNRACKCNSSLATDVNECCSRLNVIARALSSGESVYDGGEVVGTVTSASWGYRRQKNLAMAYLEPGHAEIGNRVEVTLLGSRYPAEVMLRLRPESKPGTARKPLVVRRFPSFRAAPGIRTVSRSIPQTFGKTGYRNPVPWSATRAGQCG